MQMQHLDAAHRRSTCTFTFAHSKENTQAGWVNAYHNTGLIFALLVDNSLLCFGLATFEVHVARFQAAVSYEDLGLPLERFPAGMPSNSFVGRLSNEHFFCSSEPCQG